MDVLSSILCTSLCKGHVKKNHNSVAIRPLHLFSLCVLNVDDAARLRKRCSATIGPENASLRDLVELNTLGVGTFGEVKLVLIRGDSTRSFAIKKIKKSQIRYIRDATLTEKQIMNEVNSDFIVKLHQTLKDDEYLYLLMESCLGGDLWTAIIQQKVKFTEPAVKFYIGCIAIALEHLHSMNIVYRDLKPENLLIDHQGYLKMADFGFAKKLDLNQRTMSTCGTPEYMAPEMILQQGHDVRCDYWALGVILLELFTGRRAFDAEDRDLPNINAQILIWMESKVKAVHDDLMSTEVKAVALALCQKNPEERLDGGNISHIKAYTWFIRYGFDWEALATRTMAPPFLPEIKDAMDTSHFDNSSPESNDPLADDGWDDDF